MVRNTILSRITGGLPVLFAVLLMACSSGREKEKQMQNKSEDMQINLAQEKENLLAGIHSAVCYSGFRSGQHPDRGDGAKNPSEEEILEDLQIISNEMNFRLIRLYDSGENTAAVLRLIHENNLDIKVMLGIWLNAELSAHETCEWLTEPIPSETLGKNKKANQDELDRGMHLANLYNDVVVAVNVGNEALVDWNDHKVDVDTLISYVVKVKKAIQQPVTVADNYLWWAEHGEKLAEVLDFISVHIYPVWEGKDIDSGLSYSIENIQKVRSALPNAPIVISEAGWATTASEFGARADMEKQQRYYNELMEWTKKMNITTFFFEAFDEDWKGNPNDPQGAEKHWGLYMVDRNPKLVMQ
ncbi:Exo-beta-1,3-glucanase, GH17 family [Mariniphaga anaerophila]|uniref:Endo-1,3-beta-glucanase btgC n=1 Tax=Mariniphaga anaerophila TaxID=1484053 RepID=A0A1M4YSA1_9BACT|nr:glycosyl hydrolase family 17 protein [Mariniphaga anaerophila]SHF08709.1 Exo-beta-1,3-glucanase, GH17 family [Mariniphaga anaerophila]